MGGEMIRQLLVNGILLLFSGVSQFAYAQAPGSIAGGAIQRSTGEGIPEVAITLCRDTGNQVRVASDAVGDRLPARDGIQEIRLGATPMGAPAQIAIISSSAECANPRQATTDTMGRFSFAGVAPGAYKLHGRRTGFIGEAIRAVSPEVVTQTVSVAAGQAVSDVSLFFIRGGVISGTIRDTNGNTIPSMTVQAVARSSPFPGAPLSSGQTDDRGQYRLFGLPPGEFQVVVRPIVPIARRAPVNFSTTAASEPMPASPYAITFHPSETDKEQAKVIELREGEEALRVDILLRPAPGQ
jgi:hypothetical protein